ncbi:FUSC family protein [Streptomyces sp. CA-111067]|uniref:FUSC family protein n=1 Tax=Streptomyces sp. CA-111067 TaxID=3240046 RepID=UPI003D966C37
MAGLAPGNWVPRLDPGRVRLMIAVRTVLASVVALLVAGGIAREADLPGGVVVIATVVAVLVSRSLHATSLPHRLSALVYVPAIGILAALVGRFMLHHTWLGAAVFVGAVAASRYMMRFGGKVRRFGRLALTPLISVLVVPVPPSAAKSTGPLWGGVAGLIAVACVIAVQTALPGRPTREAAAAALDLAAAAERLRALPRPGRTRTRALNALHRTALAVEDRLDAARLPGADPDRAPLDALAAAVLRVEVLAEPVTAPGPVVETWPGPSGRPGPALPDAGHAAVPERDGELNRAPVDGRAPAGPAASAAARGLAAASAPAAPPAAGPDATRPDGEFDRALADVRVLAGQVRGIDAAEWPIRDVPAPARREGGWRDPQPQTRLTLQLAASMGVAFLAGHLVFGHRWVWTVITAFVVCSAARSRGDVVHRSGLRVAGAFTGAVTGTLVAHLVAGVPAAAITVIFCYLLIGSWLRDLTYAAWAFCVTSLLAVLYSLNGEQGAALLVQRPEGILIGSACGITAAYLVLPLRTEIVMRGRTARALRVLQDLLAATREPAPEPTAIRHLSRAFDRAARLLAEAAAPARAHRALFARRGTEDAAAPARGLPWRRTGSDPHAADWADTLAECAHAARALAVVEPAELAGVGPQLGLTAQNVGQVRRRLGHRPNAAPPRPVRGGPPQLRRLNACLAELYDQLPGPAGPGTSPAAPAPAPHSAVAEPQT